MADETNTEPAVGAPGLPRVRDQQFRELYSNASFTSLGPFDVTITFAKTGDFGGQVVVVDQVSVAMSPQHFKSFCLSVTETLTAYETVFGALAIPDSDVAPTMLAPQIAKSIREARERAAAIRARLNLPAPATSSTEKKRPSRRSRGASQQKS